MSTTDQHAAPPTTKPPEGAPDDFEVLYPDPETMGVFAELIEPDPSVGHVFQLIPEGVMKGQEAANSVIGQLLMVRHKLTQANMRSTGAFITINKTDGRGRKVENITHVRAVFIDCDGGLRPTEWHVEPSIVVHSANGDHAYWLVTDCELEQFKPAQQRLAAFYGSDPVVCDLPRVMRLPGSIHWKGKPVRVELVSSPGHRYLLSEVMAGLPPVPAPVSKAPPRQRASRQAARGADDVVSVFQAAHLYRRPLDEAGKHAVVCPWAQEHTASDVESESMSTETVIWEATSESPATFHCSHAHCEGSTLRQAMAMLGVEWSTDAGGARADALDAIQARYVFVEKLDVVWDLEERRFLARPTFAMRGKPHREWISKAWDGRRSTKHTVTFEPDASKVPPDVLNLFSPDVVLAPTQPAVLSGTAAPPLFQRLLWNLAQGEQADMDYIERWLAWALRNLGSKFVALVLRGAQGTGKGLLSKLLRKIFGRYATEIGNAQLESRFNAWVAENLLVIANEVSAASIKEKVAVESKLKALITEDKAMLEHKGKDIVEIPSYSKFLFTSNDRVPLIIDAQDRRFSVVASRWKLEVMDPTLAVEFVSALDTGDLAQAVVDYLYSLDLAGFTPQTPHMNAAREEVIADGLSQAQTWWRDNPLPPGLYTSALVYKAHRRDCEANGEKAVSMAGLMRERPEHMRSVQHRRAAYIVDIPADCIGTGQNVRGIEVADIGQGGDRAEWLAQATSMVGIAAAPRLFVVPPPQDRPRRPW